VVVIPDVAVVFYRYAAIMEASIGVASIGAASIDVASIALVTSIVGGLLGTLACFFFQLRACCRLSGHLIDITIYLPPQFAHLAA
jgi:hypothetical protein